MARKKKNPTPSLLAGNTAPGSEGRTPEGVRLHLTGPHDETRLPSRDVGTPGTAERNEMASGPNPCARFRGGVGTPGTAERPRGPRLTLRLDLAGEEAALLLRNTPRGETPEAAARWWLRKILSDYEDSLLAPDVPRNGLRGLDGGRS